MPRSQFIGRNLVASVICLVFALSISPVCAQTTSTANDSQELIGQPGFDSQYGAGWLDLAPAETFRKGDRLRIKIGGTAKKVLVRLRPSTIPPTSSFGIVGGPIAVPDDREIILTIPELRENISQLSVHGGKIAWDIVLGDNNGPAKVVSVYRLR